MDKSGKLANVILGVGGFLGMGEHYVAIEFNKLKWVNEPARSTVATPLAIVTALQQQELSIATRQIGAPRRYPDHIVYNATKDQLKAMPQFKF